MPPRPNKHAPVIVSLEKMFNRVPPHAPEAEMAVLGAIILDARIMPEVAGIIPSQSAFYAEKHQQLYSALLATYANAETIDLALLATTLRSRGQFNDIGGGDYLTKLAAETPGPATAVHAAKIVAGKHRLREMIRAAGELVHSAYTTETTDPASVDSVCAAGMEKIAAVAISRYQSQDVTLEEAERQIMEDLANPECRGEMMRTGIAAIDREFGGIPRKGVMGILAAPSVGKSTIWMQVCQNLGLGVGDQEPVSTVAFSYEQPPKRAAATMLSQRAGCSIHDAMNGRTRGLHMDDWPRVEAAARNRPNIRFVSASFHALEIFNRARVYRQQGVGVIVVDYLQLIRAIPGYESGEERVSETIRTLQRIGRELDMLIVMVGQIDKDSRRQGSGENGRAPTAADFRGSSAYQDVLDLSWCLWRKGQGEPKPETSHMNEFQASMVLREWREKTGETTLIVDKNKYGPRGEIALCFNPKSMTFDEL